MERDVRNTRGDIPLMFLTRETSITPLCLTQKQFGALLSTTAPGLIPCPVAPGMMTTLVLR